MIVDQQLRWVDCHHNTHVLGANKIIKKALVGL